MHSLGFIYDKQSCFISGLIKPIDVPVHLSPIISIFVNRSIVMHRPSCPTHKHTVPLHSARLALVKQTLAIDCDNSSWMFCGIGDYLQALNSSSLFSHADSFSRCSDTSRVISTRARHRMCRAVAEMSVQLQVQRVCDLFKEVTIQYKYGRAFAW